MVKSRWRTSPRTPRAGVPQVVGLSVDDEGVDVYPLTWDGQVLGDAVARWDKGTFSAATFRRVLVVQLALTFGDGKRLTFETKTFPIGVNRHNAAVASLILATAATP